MNKLTIAGTIMIIIILAVSGTLVCVGFQNNYELLSNEELINITNAAYIQGALSVSQSGNIPYINNNTIQTTTINEVCNNLNKQEVK